MTSDKPKDFAGRSYVEWAATHSLAMSGPIIAQYKQIIEHVSKIEEAVVRLKSYTGSAEIANEVHDKIKHISATTRNSYLHIVLPLLEQSIAEVAAGKPISILNK